MDGGGDAVDGDDDEDGGEGEEEDEGDFTVAGRGWVSWWNAWCDGMGVMRDERPGGLPFHGHG